MKKCVGLVSLVGVALSILLVACSNNDNPPTPTETATTITTTTTTIATTTASTTTTSTELDIINKLPSANYMQGEITTNSVVVRASNEEVIDYIADGQLIYISGAKYGGMMEIYYCNDGKFLHGWISDNPDWYKLVSYV